MRKQYSPHFKADTVLEAFKEDLTIAQLGSDKQVHPSQIHAWKAHAQRELHTLFEPHAQRDAVLKAEYEKKIHELYAEIGRLTTQVEWMKKNLALKLSRNERLALVEREEAALSLTTQCELLGFNRPSLYYQPVPPSPQEIALKHRIDAIYTEHPFYGSRKIVVALQPDFFVNRKAVQRHMREMGLAAIVPGPHLSKPHPDHKIYPYLLRNVKVKQPNQVWGIDITYIRLAAGWMYLVAILDWFSRYVVSWELAQTLELPFVLVAVERALTGATPQIINSDQGGHFTSPQYLEPLLQKQIAISMDGRGRALDNIFTERLWRSVKYEEVYLREYGAPKEARHGLARYFDFYNHKRPHQALDYRTPAEVYFN